MSAPMEIFFFHLMPWSKIPEDVTQKYGSSWVVLPNSHYEPQLGHELYNQYLDQLEFGDQIGFDALCVNEHHQNGYGLMPSPNIMAATLARRTKNAKIAILGNGINLRENPLRVAEEVAMLDVISGGRILSGFVRGIGAEYYSLNLDPSQSRSRFHEAHDLIIKAWTEPGPFEWDGEHFRFRYVNVWPRVFQKPHPPIFSPSQGSAETIRWAAKHGYPYICTYAPIDQLVHYYTLYRQIAAEEYGYAAGPEKFGWTSMVYVAKDEKTAVEEARAHIEYFNKRCFALPPQMLVPPGYTSPDSFRNMVQTRMARPTQFDYDEMIATGQALIGTPEQVGERLLRNMERAGTGIFMGAFQVGDMPHAKVMKNLELFAKEVLPHLPRTKHDYRAKHPLPARAAG